MPTKRTDPKYIRAYDRGMLRSAFVSLFWDVIMERKRRGSFTLQALAKILGTNKGEVSRWFNGDPNWTVNTIAGLSNALDVEIHLYAVDRITGVVFTPSGIQTPVMAHANQVSIEQRTETAPVPNAPPNVTETGPLTAIVP